MKVIQSWVIIITIILFSGFSTNIVNADVADEYETCIDLEKPGPETATPGDTITYHFKVTNCGEVPLLSGFQVYDPLFGSDAIRDEHLYPGDVDEFDMTYVVTIKDCGEFTNNAWAIGHPVLDGLYLPLVRDDDSWITDVICEEEKSSLGDFVWLDSNKNGIQDSEETGIDDVIVNLYDCLDNLITSTTTTDGGYYLFIDLVPGEYYVEFVKPGGYVFSPSGQGGDNALNSDANLNTGMTACTTLLPGENDTTWDAGLYEPAQPASLGNYVWEDLNSDGIQNDGDTGFPGIVVNLFDCESTLIGTTTTDSDGYYLFDNLTPDCYAIQFEKPAGYEFSPLNNVDDNTIDSDALPSGATIHTTLESGENDLTWDAGLITIATSEIGDFVWEDLNVNGVQDAGEPGIEDVNVNLYDCSNNLIMTKTTDANGFYLFSNLPAGDYYLVFEAPADYLPSPRNIGSDEADSDANMKTGKTGCTTLNLNESDRTWDAGFYRLASIGNLVWQDTNSDGIQNAEETGIDDVVVNLYDCLDNFIASTITTDGGYYLFENLDPTEYYIEFVKPDGYEFSPSDQGNDNTIDSDADSSTGQTKCTTLTSGENDLTWDAGLVQIIAPKEIGTIIGDPHFVGGDGGKFDFHGYDGGVYKLLFDKGFHLNGEFASSLKNPAKMFVKKTLISVINSNTKIERILFLPNGVAKLNRVKLNHRDNITLPDGTRVRYLDLRNHADPNSVLRIDSITGRGKIKTILRVWTPEGYFIEQAVVGEHINIGVRTPGQGVANGMLPDGLLGQTFDEDVVPMTADDFVGDDYKVNTLRNRH